MDKHLWEIKHNYHCTGQHGENYESFTDYLDEFGDADPDYNLIIRWDWFDFNTIEEAKYHGYYDGCYGEIKPYESDEKINGILNVYIVAQRHGYVIESTIKVCRADEPKVIEYLNKGKDYLFNLWNPL